MTPAIVIGVDENEKMPLNAQENKLAKFHLLLPTGRSTL